MPESRKQNAIKNIRYGLLSKVITLILAFIARTVFIWGLGAELLGLNAVFSDVLGLLSMADLGFGIAMVYSFYEPLANDDRDKISGLITFYRKVYLVIAIAVSIVGIALVPALPYLINLDNPVPGIEVYYLLALANVVVSYLFVYKTSILTADQKNYVVVRVSLYANIVKTVLQVLCIILFRSYLSYLIIGVCATLAANLITSRIAGRRYPFIGKRVELEAEDRKGISRNLSSVFLFKLSSVLINATDNILISIIVGTIAVGCYSNYMLVQTQIITFYSLIFTSMTASVGNLIIMEKPKKRYAVFSVQQSAGLIIATILVPCFVVLINEFITIWIGEQYTFDLVTVIAIGLNMYLSCVLQPLWTFREATGLYQKTKWIMVICAMMNIALSILLGKIMGVAGIIFASAVSRLSTYMWYEPKLLFHTYFDRRVAGYYLKLLINLILVVLITGAGVIASNAVPVTGILGWVCKAAILFVICSCISLLVYRRSPGVEMMRDWAANKTRKNKNKEDVTPKDEHHQ